MPEPEEEDEEIISPIIHSEPIISSFSDRQEERVEPLIPEKTQETAQAAKISLPAALKTVTKRLPLRR